MKSVYIKKFNAMIKFFILENFELKVRSQAHWKFKVERLRIKN